VSALRRALSVAALISVVASTFASGAAEASVNESTCASGATEASAAKSARKAQTGAPATEMVTVDGRRMRVAVAGLRERKPGQPVIILEAGAGETGIEPWTPVFAKLARVAPVLAYDRRGVGQSEADSVKTTLRRSAQSLHALLQKLSIAPPYVLVGHSWGGLVTRAFFDQYSQEVAGFVFLDAVNPGRTREERARGLAPDEQKKALAPPEVPTIPADTPPRLRAEYELVLSETVNDYPEARLLRLPTGVPIAVVRASPPGRSLGAIELGPNELAGLALRSPKGLYLAAGHVGHNVQRDDPDLVVQLGEHVLRFAVTSPKPQ
jgi:pimeloyl-ACP methyl ester carboxylesterase